MKLSLCIFVFVILFASNAKSYDNISLRNIDVITDFSSVRGYVEINEKFFVATAGGLIIYTNDGLEYVNHTGAGYLTGINVVFNDGDSLIWIGTEREGILSYNVNTQRFSSSIFFRDVPIHDIYRHGNFIMLATQSGLAIVDARDMGIIESYFDDFGLLSNIVEQVVVKRDSVFIKIDNFVGSCHINGNFGNRNQWSFIPDSLAQSDIFDSDGKMRRDMLPGLRENIKIRYWWNNVITTFVNTQLFVLGFYNRSPHNLVGFNRGEFFRPIYSATWNNDVTAAAMNDRFVTISIQGTQGGLLVVDRETMQEDTFYTVGRYPSVWLRDVDINDENVAVAVHWRFAVNEGDTGRNVNFAGGISFTDVETGEINVFTSSESEYMHEVFGVESNFEIHFNEELGFIYTQSLNHVKYGPGTTLWLISRDNAVFLYDFYAYNNNSNDSLLATTILEIQGAPSAVRSDNYGRLFVSGGSNIAVLTTTGANILSYTYTHTHNINDFYFVSDSLLVAATDDGVVFFRYRIDENQQVEISKHHHITTAEGLPERQVINVAYDRAFNSVYAIGNHSLAVVNLFEFYSQEFLSMSRARVYPVPLYASEGTSLYIDNLLENESQIRIYSSSGRLVYSVDFLGPGKTYMWNPNVASGIYYIVVSDSRGKERLKALIFN